jgi:hypothetical protein
MNRKMTLSLVFLMLLALLLCTTGPAWSGMRTAFSNDFSQGLSPLWSNDSGNWGLQGGYYTGGYYTAIKGLILANITVDVDYYQVGDGGIWLRSAYNSGAVNGVILVTRSGDIYWHVFQNGSILSPTFRGYTGITWSAHPHVKVVVKGHTFSAYVDGNPTPVTSFTYEDTDPQYYSGLVGLYNNGGTLFSKVVVSAPFLDPGISTLLMGD